MKKLASNGGMIALLLICLWPFGLDNYLSWKLLVLIYVFEIVLAGGTVLLSFGKYSKDLPPRIRLILLSLIGIVSIMTFIALLFTVLTLKVNSTHPYIGRQFFFWLVIPYFCWLEISRIRKSKLRQDSAQS